MTVVVMHVVRARVCVRLRMRKRVLVLINARGHRPGCCLRGDRERRCPSPQW
jgi:hypothetical protein